MSATACCRHQDCDHSICCSTSVTAAACHMQQVYWCPTIVRCQIMAVEGRHLHVCNATPWTCSQNADLCRPCDLIWLSSKFSLLSEPMTILMLRGGFWLALQSKDQILSACLYVCSVAMVVWPLDKRNLQCWCCVDTKLLNIQQRGRY